MSPFRDFSPRKCLLVQHLWQARQSETDEKFIKIRKSFASPISMLMHDL